jgi:hypothetical protein
LALNRLNKVCVAIALCSLLVYGLYWVYSEFRLIYLTLIGVFPLRFPGFYIDLLPGGLGDLIRVIGVFVALAGVYLFWGPNPRPFSIVKKYFSVALLFEGLFWLLAFPVTGYSLIRGRIVSILPVAYTLQILLVSPLLIISAAMMWRYQDNSKERVAKWVSAAGLGYLTSIWIVNVFRWFGMAQSVGVGFLLTGTTSLGFLNSAITLSLSLIFASLGFFTLSKHDHRKLATRFFALSLMMLSLFFVIFIIYTAVTNSWKFLLVTEIWPVAFIALGISLLKKEFEG